MYETDDEERKRVSRLIILGSFLTTDLLLTRSASIITHGNTGPKRFKSRLCPGQSCSAHCARFELMYLPVGLDEFKLETRRIYSSIERAKKVMIVPRFLICTKRNEFLKDMDKVNTHSQTSNTTCCKRSGNFCTIVTGWPLVKLTPYIGAVVLYLVLHNLAGEPHVSLEENPLPERKSTSKTHKKDNFDRYLEFIIIFQNTFHRV